MTTALRADVLVRPVLERMERTEIILVRRIAAAGRERNLITQALQVLSVHFLYSALTAPQLLV